MLEIIGLGIVLLIVLAATGFLKTVRRVADVASTSMESAANMAEREMKKLELTHKDKVAQALAKIEVNADTYTLAKTNLDTIKSFEL